MGSAAIDQAKASTAMIHRVSSTAPIREPAKRWQTIEAAFVWAAWTAMSIAAFALIGVYGQNVPFWDEWNSSVPILAGFEEITVRNLWRPHNEHRLVVPFFIWIGLDRTFGHDFRSAMYFSAVVLSLVSAVLVLSARQVRGRTEWSDCVFPAVLLSWGHCDNLIWGFQIQFVLIAVLSGFLLCVVMLHPSRLTVPGWLFAIYCMAMAPLCLAAGLAVSTAMVPWLVFAAWRSWKGDALPDRRLAPAIGVSALAILIVVALAFIPRAVYHPPPATVRQFIKDALRVLAMAFGPATWSEERLTQFFVAVLCALTIGVCAFAWFRMPNERLRIAGLVFLLLSSVVISAAISWGRSALGGIGYRHTTLVAPLICTMYFAWRLYLPARVRANGAATIAVLALAAYAINLPFGLERARIRYELLTAFKNDLVAGVPKSELAARYNQKLYPDAAVIDAGLQMLKDARFGYFEALRTEPSD